VRSGRPQRRAWAAWLGLLALALNALIPIHLALDLGEAFAATHRETPAAPHHGLEWRLWALVTGHEAGDGKPEGKPDDDHHGPTCPAFGVLGALGGFAVVAPPALPMPAVVEASPVLAATTGIPDRTAATAYRSRAPPLG
jgi:hypothetical protein